MKVKNIMFFGFAAAILSAGAASAASTETYDALTGRTPNASEKNIVTSKYYVDTGVKALRDDVNAIQIPDVSALESASHTHANGTNTTYTDNDGVISINVPGVSSVDGADSAAIPTVGALTGYVSGVQSAIEGQIDALDTASHTHADGTHTTAVTQDGVVTINVADSGTVTSGNNELVTGGTVYTAIQNQAVNTVVAGDNNGQIKVDNQNVSVTGLQNAAYQTVATEIADSGTGLTTSDQVYDYVAGVQSAIEGQIDTLNSASHTHADGTHTTATEVNGVVTINVADSGTVTSGNNELVTGGTVYTAIQDQALQASEITTGTAGSHSIKVNGTDVEVSEWPVQTGVICSSTTPCALVDDGTGTGSKIWRPMAI